jgi:signal transduction histidine kinase
MELKGKTVLQAVVRDISERKRAEEAVLRERAILRRLLESSDRDRRLTAYEIHDGFAQHIAGARMQLEAASQLKDESPKVAAQAYERGLELLSWGLDEARCLISGLRPPILDEAGVVAAIEHLVHDPSMQEGPEVGFVFDAKFGRLEPLLENAIFRIVQESVTNACRYSESSKVQVRLTQQESRIYIEVEDWGVGFNTDDIEETSFGIGGIKERARLLGGQATIDSTPGKGTLVRVELPLVESE